MRKLSITEFVSLDGVMEAPGGEPGYKHVGWVFKHGGDGEHGEFKSEELENTEALLLGRVTYEGFAAAWPERSGDFADKFNSMPKYVVSTTLDEDLEWTNSSVLRDIDAVRALKEGDGGEISVHGSRTLAQSLIRANLVDEYRIMVFPVILGHGRRLFPDDMEDKIALELTDSRSYPNGVTVNTYHPTA